MSTLQAAVRPDTGLRRRRVAPAALVLGATRMVATFVCHVAFWLAVWALGPTLFGWHSVALVTGSMAPLLNTGDIVVVEPYDGSVLGPGTIIEFRVPGTDRLVTHRIVGIHGDGSYRTRGDANQAPDSTPVPPSAIVGVGRLRVPLVGMLQVWWQGREAMPLVGTMLLLTLAMLLRGSAAPSVDAAPRGPGRWRVAIRLLRLGVVLVLTAVIATHLTTAAWARTTANTGNAWTASRIFPGTRSSSAHVIGDASGAAGSVDSSDPVSYAGDGLTATTGTWSNAFSGTRYLEFAYEAPLAAGQAVTSPTFRFDYASGTGGVNMCWYMEVRRTSTSAVLATYGSAGTPLDCNSTTTLRAVSTSIPIVTTTDIADDLSIRLYARGSVGASMTVDRATVTGTATGLSFRLLERQYVDASTGTPATTAWSLQAADGASFWDTGQTWDRVYDVNRYVTYGFDAWVPPSSLITAVSFTTVWRSQANNKTFCYFFAVYNGATLLGTHGSAGSPVHCDSSNNWMTDTVSLTEVTTVADANAITIKLWGWDGGSKRTSHDLARVDITYSTP